jgi:hypothetical protein
MVTIPFEAAAVVPAGIFLLSINSLLLAELQYGLWHMRQVSKSPSKTANFERSILKKYR